MSKDCAGDPSTGRTPRKAEKIVLVVDDFRQWVAVERGLYSVADRRILEKPSSLRKALVAAGLYRPDGEGRTRYTVRPGKSLEVVANFKIEEGTTWDRLKAFQRDPEDLWPHSKKM